VEASLPGRTNSLPSASSVSHPDRDGAHSLRRCLTAVFSCRVHGAQLNRSPVGLRHLRDSRRLNAQDGTRSCSLVDRCRRRWHASLARSSRHSAACVMTRRLPADTRGSHAAKLAARAPAHTSEPEISRRGLLRRRRALELCAHVLREVVPAVASGACRFSRRVARCT